MLAYRLPVHAAAPPPCIHESTHDFVGDVDESQDQMHVDNPGGGNQPAPFGEIRGTITRGRST
jgi:hypothetical protein